MSEHFDKGPSSAAEPQEADVIALLKKIQQQMVFLEKKIDTLLGGHQNHQPSQPSGERSFDRPSFKDRHFSKPARSFDTRTEHYGRPDSYRRPGPGGGDRPDRGGFGQDRPSYGGRPSYGRPRRDDHRGGPGGGPGGRPGGPGNGGSGFGGPKKPFYKGRKDRA